jgi:3-oxoacyl-[acyl-carrier protein] reductase
MDLGLQGRIVFITGASGGIGQALARAFAAEGASLVLQAHSNLDALKKLVDEAALGDRTLLLEADVSDPTAMETAMAHGVSHFGRLDACVINAGIWPKEDGVLAELPVARLRETIEVNLMGAIWTARAFMQQLMATGSHPDGEGASVTLIGSTAGRFGEQNHSDYSITKAAMYGMLRSLKNELPAIDPFARINLVEPGWTATPMAYPALDNPGVISGVLRTMPLAQIARAADIASAVLFLSSPLAARHITGEVLTVAGGMEGRVQRSSESVDEEAVRKRLLD